MAAPPKTQLLQQALYNGKPLDLSFCLEAVLVETFDLSGPRLILKFNDLYSILRNVLKIKPGARITCLLQDLMHENVMDYTDTFYVMSMPVEGNIVTLNCLSAGINTLKFPALTATIVPKTTIKATVMKIAPSFSAYDIDDGASLNSYHILPGERPSLVLRQAARENGCFCYVDRGKLCFKTYDNMFNQRSDIVFEYKNPLAKYQIIDYQHINNEQMFRDVAQRVFCGFSLVDGFMIDQSAGAFPYEMTSLDQIALMQNEMKLSVPTLDIITWGAGHIRPGTAISFAWNLDAAWKDATRDESLPTKAIVGSVAHHSSGATNYFCRVKAAVRLSIRDKRWDN